MIAPRSRTPRLLLALALVIAGALWMAHAAAPTRLAEVSAGLVALLGKISMLAMMIAGTAYERVPAASVGIAALALVPALALLSLLVRSVGRLHRNLVGDRDLTTVRHRQPVVPPSPQAWIEVAGRRRERVQIRGDVLRIGRDVENDLVLAAPGLADVHAVIARNGDRGFVVVDTSGGPGVALNGRPVASAALADGDRIGLGETSIVFRHGRLRSTAKAASAMSH